MNLFLDTSVVLAACGSSTGAARFILQVADHQGWTLLTSNYVIREVEVNLPKLPSAGGGLDTWQEWRGRLDLVPDMLTFDWVTVFDAAKDRPILFTALAWADVLLTLDHADFGKLLNTRPLA